ncbi:MAG: hypothetical protein BV456_01020 [Thermoplasmata archaeon M8B2D]|nr:MAG: hypothetical protein BV456_01020 [Thermoplasmata archaeon M8B2D]
MTLNIIETKTNKEHTATLQYNLPSGRAFVKKFDNTSNLYKLLFAWAKSFKLCDDDLNRLFNELNPETTTELITEWEKRFAIPDKQFTGTGTIDKRRQDVLAKMNAQGIQTEFDYENFLELLGYDVEIIGNGNAPEVYNWDWKWLGDIGYHPWSDGTESKNRFWLIVKFFGTYTDLNELREFLKTIVPSNVYINFLED